MKKNMKEMFTISKRNGAVIRSAWSKMDKASTSAGNPLSILADKTINRTASLSVKLYNDLVDGKRGAIPGKYMTGIHKTKGSYRSRDRQILASVDNMYQIIITKGLSSADLDGAGDLSVMDLYRRIYNIIAGKGRKKWEKVYNKAYKLHMKGNDIATHMYSQYSTMAYALEYMTLTFINHLDAINAGESEDMNSTYCDMHSTFINVTAKSIVPILYNCESTSNPEGQFNDQLRAGTEIKHVKSTESFDDELIVLPKDMSHDVIRAEESFVLAVVYASVAVVAAMASIQFIRYSIYAISCLTIDIGEELKDQSYILLVGIEKLEVKLSKMDSKSSEYKKLEKVIEKQKKYTGYMIMISEKLLKKEMKDLDTIRESEYDDNELIESAIDDDDDDSTIIEI